MLRPTQDRVVVRPTEAETVLPSGIVLPQTALERPQRGEVLAVGPGLFDDQGDRVPLDLLVGDTVIYSRYGGAEIEHDDEKLLILRVADVLAVVD